MSISPGSSARRSRSVAPSRRGPFDSLLDALNDNRGDAVIASIAPTADTRRRADFTDPYYRTPARFVARLDSPITDVLPERLEGKKIAVVAGTAHEAYLKTMFTEAQVRAYPNAEAAREALRDKDVDLLFGDGIALAFWLNGADSAGCCSFRGGPFLESRFFGEGVGIAVKRDNDLLRQALNWALFQLWEKGSSPTCGCAISRSARFDAACDADANAYFRHCEERQRRSNPASRASQLDCLDPSRSHIVSFRSRFGKTDHSRPFIPKKQTMTAMTIEDASNLRALAEQSNAWPFEEARKIVARLKKHPKDEVIFETGYGPSGLPHIGTFGEVARTTMVRHAFRVLTDDKIKTRLIAFSDDMDGLRKVPDNIPNKEMVAQHLNKPLTEVPDPFGTHDSFGEHNNARLRAFLDQFGFDYEFMSSTACYTSGRFDDALLKVLAHFEQVMAIMLPSLREERAQSYSPFLPISPRTRAVLQVPVLAHDAKAGTITYEDPDTREQVTTPVTGGRCKLQWKPDWAMRWVALGVDYEMAGKDLIDSVKLSGEICRALGGVPPEGFNYELFLDETGQKISKSKGNGLTIDEWLRYASPESLRCSCIASRRRRSGSISM